ncbi:MAG: hypothetical protein AB7O80_24530 [Acetobacteraceae bacterium]
MRILLLAVLAALVPPAALAQDEATARDRLIRRHEQVLEQERQRQEQIQKDRAERREEFRREREDAREDIQRRAAEREARSDRERYSLPGQ